MLKFILCYTGERWDSIPERRRRICKCVICRKVYIFRKMLIWLVHGVVQEMGLGSSREESECLFVQIRSFGYGEEIKHKKVLKRKETWSGFIMYKCMCPYRETGLQGKNWIQKHDWKVITKFISWIKSSGGKPMEKQTFSYTFGRNVNWYNFLEDNLLTCSNFTFRIYLIDIFTNTQCDI